MNFMNCKWHYLLKFKLENTFILTLDGDVEFRSLAVKLMIDKMKADVKIGSVSFDK